MRLKTNDISNYNKKYFDNSALLKVIRHNETDINEFVLPFVGEHKPDFTKKE